MNQVSILDFRKDQVGTVNLLLYGNVNGNVCLRSLSLSWTHSSQTGSDGAILLIAAQNQLIEESS